MCLYMYIHMCVYTYIHTRTHTHTNISHKKKNEILLFAAPWVDPESIMFNEISLTKANAVCYHLYVKLKNKTTEYI